MRKKIFTCLLSAFFILQNASAQSDFNGLESNMSNIFRMSDAKTGPSVRKILTEKKERVAWPRKERERRCAAGSGAGLEN